MRKYEKHGMRKTKIYKTWASMKYRCGSDSKSNYPYYKAKGITVCGEWLNSFTSFFKWAINNGYSDELEIDRIDNNKNYEPINCRWVSEKTQSRNTTMQKNNTSGIIGVSWYKNYQKWVSIIGMNGKSINLGYFDTIEEAAVARNSFIDKHGTSHTRSLF